MSSMDATFIANRQSIAELLSTCETTGLAEAYMPTVNKIVTMRAENKDVYVISDLHVGGGKGSDANYRGTENFFADESLLRFLRHATEASKAKSRNSILVINGDFIDFLRIVDVPRTDEDFNEWQYTLEMLNPTENRTVGQLEIAIQEELKQGYGLKTNDYKSVWKLLIARRGHPVIFVALAEWLLKGNQIVVTKGNHDLEWYWLLVRNHLRLILAEEISRVSGTSPVDALKDTVLANTIFIDNAVVIDGELYIAHGHEYDKFSLVVPLDQPVLNFNGSEELNIPFGSFFNRYLINKLELRYPYLDNVRPRNSLLPMLIKKDFPLAIRVFFKYIPCLLKSVRKRYYAAMYLQAVLLFLALAIPFAILFFHWKEVLIPWISSLFSNQNQTPGVAGFLERTGLEAVQSLGLMILSYFLSRIVSALHLEEPTSLAENARDVFRKSKEYKIITFGHTHDPEQFVEGNRWFYNTGTWIPIVEATSGDIREDKTYTFVHLDRDAFNRFVPRPVLRWDDDAGRIEELVLINRNAKEESPRRKQLKKAIRRVRWGFVKP